MHHHSTGESRTALRERPHKACAHDGDRQRLTARGGGESDPMVGPARAGGRERGRERDNELVVTADCSRERRRWRRRDGAMVEEYLRQTSEECEVSQIEPEIVIALNEGENEMKIDVISDKPENPQIEREEDQPLVLVQPPTFPYTFITPYKGVEVREGLQIFYSVDTFVLDDPDATNSFMLEVPNELLNMTKGVHASLSKYVDVSFVVDISK
ncbi:hypothetical protein Syun_030144 [Stephania yunnanensis]|uniref:Uncharacterized protein n=1 Tax=Stephania yunnanensis TaxID=152371 RepID=A0AAP0HM19_9MAGN